MSIVNAPPQRTWPSMGSGQLRPNHSLMVCLTCQHFQHTLAEEGVTQPASTHHQQRLPQRAHLTYRCHQWIQRLENEIGWCPEGA
ncbi:galactose oxidase [Synechococcus sp. MU1642]|nr:galactose oxidase [Synechococcus sp. MU1642]